MKIVITVNQDGTVSIEGPLHEKMFMYGLLEVVKDTVRDYKPEEQSRIVQVRPALGG